MAIGEYVAISDEYGKYGNQRQLLYRLKYLYLETMHILYSITVYYIYIYILSYISNYDILNSIIYI